MIGVWIEVLDDVIGHEECHPPGSAMEESGLDCQSQVSFGGHVVNCVVGEDGVELTTEANCSHVPREVFTLRVEALGNCEHFLGEIHQSQVEEPLQIEGDVAATAAQLQHLARESIGG